MPAGPSDPPPTTDPKASELVNILTEAQEKLRSGQPPGSTKGEWQPMSTAPKNATDVRARRQFVIRWARHAAMHAGAIFAAVYHGALPPQVGHTEEQLARLDSATAWRWFVRAATGRLDDDPRASR